MRVRVVVARCAFSLALFASLAACDGTTVPAEPDAVSTPDALVGPGPDETSSVETPSVETPPVEEPPVEEPPVEEPPVEEPPEDFVPPVAVTPVVTGDADEPTFQQPKDVPTSLPYEHMPVPDPTVEGWQPAPLNPYPQMIDPRLQESGFEHVQAAKPLLMKKPVWQPWTRGSRIAVHEDTIYVAGTEIDRLVALDRHSGAVVASIRLDGEPNQVVVSPSGRVFVSLRRTGEVAEVSVATASVVDRRSVGSEAVGLALTPDAKRLLVTDRSGGRLVGVDIEPALGSPTELASGLDFPSALAVSPSWLLTVVTRGQSVTQFVVGGATLLSEHAVDLRLSSPYGEHCLQGRDLLVTANGAVSAAVQPETGAAMVLHSQRIAGSDDSLSADVKAALEALVPFPYYGVTRSWRPSHIQLARAIENSVSTIGPAGALEEMESRPVRNPRTLEPLTLAMSVARDIAHHPTLTLAFVASAGTDSVVMLNTALPDPMVAPLGTIEVGMAPVATAFSADGWYAYILDSQSFAVSEVDLRGLFALGAPSANAPSSGVAYAHAAPFPFGQVEATDAVELSHSRWARYGSDPLPEDARLGRRIFFDARNPRVTGVERFACASCHIDGDEDQTVWWFPSGPRQTPSLAGRLEDTAPFNWNGTREELTANFKRTIGRMGGTGASEDELLSLERYLYEGLRAPNNPNLGIGGLDEAQARGKEIFEDPEVGCASCHIPGAYTDGLAYDLGVASLGEIDANLELAKVGLADPLVFNTPSLRGVWHTAPYLHDGSASTLSEVLERTRGRMGNTADLTEEQKSDLIRYLQTL
ncbi:MAG: hypothetical protein H6744_06110 [Deltaproteobacteria bacterium]|nr:hypothetical protein [Deltaproteobacteria bacterium]MCB9786253.1 hypothetical protein [Deltaproteobacteria bacterium]